VNFDKQVTIPASLDEAWAFLMDIPTVSRCLPGVESVEEIEPDVYGGVMKVKVGAIRVSFQGRIEVTERDREAHRAGLRVQGADNRIGSAMTATVEMQLESRSKDEVELRVTSEATVLGKLGELGQAVMLRKADQIMSAFADNVAQALAAPGHAPVEPPAAEETNPAADGGLFAWLRRLLRRS
jgi:carbon monoxide dehydrogenase subunit G